MEQVRISGVALDRHAQGRGIGWKHREARKRPGGNGIFGIAPVNDRRVTLRGSAATISERGPALQALSQMLGISLRCFLKFMICKVPCG